MTLVPTIVCGGSGTRLWPVSREQHPKPFIRMPDGHSLIQKALLRVSGLPAVAEVLTVTNRDLMLLIQDEYREVARRGLPASFILEPLRRNTAPAVAVAALYVAQTFGEAAVMLVQAADHLITDQEAFGRAVGQAVALAQQGDLVTFGIRPESPHTGYGYIEAEGSRVVRFVEKPDRETAESFLAAGTYLWNSGMFCFTAGAILREMERHCPDVLGAARACVEATARQPLAAGTLLDLDETLFAQVPEISIDYAVMERSDRIRVVPCAIGWNDIGSWTSLGELEPADADGNRLQGEVVVHGVRDCFIQGEGRLIGAVGVDNLFIVDTPDALLVADRSRIQEVKELFGQLKAAGHPAAENHRTVHRPWGTYTVLEEYANFKVKRIVVKPKSSLSLQMHYHRSEHWVVVSGTARVVNGDQEMLIQANQSTYIPAGQLHRLENPGTIDLVMIEVQSGEYLGEDDIVRFDDKYGRVAAGAPE